MRDPAEEIRTVLFRYGFSTLEAGRTGDRFPERPFSYMTRENRDKVVAREIRNSIARCKGIALPPGHSSVENPATAVATAVRQAIRLLEPHKWVLGISIAVGILEEVIKAVPGPRSDLVRFRCAEEAIYLATLCRGPTATVARKIAPLLYEAAGGKRDDQHMRNVVTEVLRQDSPGGRRKALQR